MSSSPSAPSESSPTPRPRRRGARAYLVLAAVSVLAIGGWFLHRWWTQGKVDTDNAQVEADVVPVSARVGGTVARLLVADNQRVARGDVLLELDPADLDVMVARAEADLEAANAQADVADAQVAITEKGSAGGLSTARAQLSGASASARTADAQIAAAKAALTRARGDLATAEIELARAQKLVTARAITGSELERYQSARDTAAATVQQAEAQLDAAREQRHAADSRVAEAAGRVEQSAPVDEQVGAARATARLAHARVKAAEAALAHARLDRQHATVTAPADGVTSRLAVRAGQQVQPGQTLVMVVPETTYVIANFKETEVGRIRPGDRVDIEVDAFPDAELHGVVDSVAAATGARFSLLPPDNASGNFVKVVQRVPVKITWNQPPTLPLRPGMSVEVTVHVH